MVVPKTTSFGVAAYSIELATYQSLNGFDLSRGFC